MAVWSIVRFKLSSNYKIEVSFAGGKTGVADLAPRLSQAPLLSRQRAGKSLKRFLAGAHIPLMCAASPGFLFHRLRNPNPENDPA